MPDRILVVIPTYNEAENIGPLIDALIRLSEKLDVLVVDDASPDGTAQVVCARQQRYPGRVHLLVRSTKQGLGPAYVAGFRYALAQPEYVLIAQMDADFSHRPLYLARMLRRARRGWADLVIGSRYVRGVNVINWPLTRLLISYGASVFVRFITGMPVRDATAGFKVFHRRVLESLPLERVHSNGYVFQIELTYRTWRAGFRIREFPIIFFDRRRGASKMSGTIIWEAFFKVLELRLRTLLGRL
ncbi:MAG: polyprenol monophosphomannose synthase [Bacteroidota bacterium]|nr:polyprenol monophosphomannose synthase [Rhodothermia bacterium]MDW8285112.1 polyprenol monophosphomannose synthase [Bacteroidota bacterium]